MPLKHLILILSLVIAAAGATVWLIAGLPVGYGSAVLVAALIAAVIVRRWAQHRAPK